VVQQSQPPGYVEPSAKRYLERAEGLSNEPFTPFPQAKVAPLTPEHELGLAMTSERALTGSPEMGAARNQLYGTTSGDYLNANPYLDQMYNQASRAVTDQYQMATDPGLQAQGIQAGDLNNTGTQQYRDWARFGLGENLSGLAANIYGGNYQNERNRQMSALGMAPQYNDIDYRDAQALLGVGDVRREYNQGLLSQSYEDFERERLQPYANVDVLGNAIGASMGTGGTTSTTQPTFFQPNRTASALGGGLLGYGAGSLLGFNPLLGAGAGALGGLLL